jgi:hypothetical protein
MDDEHKKPGIAFYGCVVVTGLLFLLVVAAVLAVLFGHAVVPWQPPK